jgi:hypothetical protein
MRLPQLDVRLLIRINTRPFYRERMSKGPPPGAARRQASVARSFD